MNFSEEADFVDRNCGISVLPNQALPSLCEGLGQGDYVLIQVMNMRKDGECKKFLSNMSEKGVRIFINFDEQASMLNGESSPFGLDDSIGIKFERTRLRRPSFPVPIFNNHIRLLITPYSCAFSTMDIGGKHNYKSYQEPLYLISDTEITEQLKALFFQSPKSYGRYGSVRFTTAMGNELTLDDGKGQGNEVINAANDFIYRNSGKDKSLTIVSSWFPDACYGQIRRSASLGTKINIVTLKPSSQGGKGGFSELPFSATKSVSLLLSHGLPSNIKINFADSLHGKFILAQGPMGESSFITTSNLTNWGVLASSEEMAISTSSPQTSQSLKEFISKYLKFT